MVSAVPSITPWQMSETSRTWCRAGAGNRREHRMERVPHAIRTGSSSLLHTRALAWLRDRAEVRSGLLHRHRCRIRSPPGQLPGLAARPGHRLAG
jgi:hypothetical protein